MMVVGRCRCRSVVVRGRVRLRVRVGRRGVRVMVGVGCRPRVGMRASRVVVTRVVRIPPASISMVRSRGRSRMGNVRVRRQRVSRVAVIVRLR